MSIFNLFKKKSSKSQHQVYFDTITEVIELLRRKKDLVQKMDGLESFVDFGAETEAENLKIIAIVSNGSLSFLSKDLQIELLGVFEDPEINKRKLANIWNYLVNEQEKLSKLIS